MLRAALVVMVLASAAVMAPRSEAIALSGIRFYQQTLGPLAARAGLACRFTPSCSQYAEIAIAREGLVKGGWKAIGRIARCGPWTAAGTVDDP